MDQPTVPPVASRCDGDNAEAHLALAVAQQRRYAVHICVAVLLQRCREERFAWVQHIAAVCMASRALGLEDDRASLDGKGWWGEWWDYEADEHRRMMVSYNAG